MLFLLKLMYENEDLNLLSEPFGLTALEPVNVNSGSSKIMFKNLDSQPQLLPFLGDRFIWREFKFVLSESNNYTFQLFEFFNYLVFSYSKRAVEFK